MNLQNNKTKNLISVLRILEFFYIAVSIVIVFYNKLPSDLLAIWLDTWVKASYFILPILLFKNIIVALYSNGTLTKQDKGWMLLRCLIYFTLSFFAYPLILSL